MRLYNAAFIAPIRVDDVNFSTCAGRCNPQSGTAAKRTMQSAHAHSASGFDLWALMLLWRTDALRDT